MAREEFDEDDGGLDDLNEEDYGNASGQDAEVDELQQFLQRQQELKRQAAMQGGGAAAEIAGARNMQYRPAVGNFMFPREQTWAAHRELILDDGLNLGFSPVQYPAFDREIHQNIDLAPFYDFNASRYPKYDVARENLAIVRNYILNEFFRDGKIDDEKFDRKKLKQLNAIAKEITKGFNNDGLLRNPMQMHLSMAKANEPAKGAQYIYSKILQRQNAYNWLGPIGSLAGLRYEWNLPDVAHSPFSTENLAKPPPGRGDVAALTDEEIADAVALFEKEKISIGEPIPDVQDPGPRQFNKIADSFVEASLLAMSVDQLEQPTKREAIDHAKNILEKLKVSIGSSFISHGLDQFGDKAMQVLGDLKTLVDTYTINLNKLAGLDPNTYDNPAVEAANKALGKLSYLAKAETLLRAYAANDKKIIATVESQLKSMPQAWVPQEGETFEGLLNDLESGLKTVVLRITQIAEQDHTAESWLGFSNQNALGGANRNTPGGAKANTSAMQNDDFYRQMNAQRALRARQAAMRYSARVQQQDHDGHEAPAAKPQGMEGLLQGADLSSMRNAMQTTKNAAPVATGNKATLQNIQLQQAQRASRMAALESGRRVARRQREQHEGDHHHHANHEHKHHEAEEIAAPTGPMHKKDRGIGH